MTAGGGTAGLRGSGTPGSGRSGQWLLTHPGRTIPAFPAGPSQRDLPQAGLLVGRGAWVGSWGNVRALVLKACEGRWKGAGLTRRHTRTCCPPLPGPERLLPSPARGKHGVWTCACECTPTHKRARACTHRSSPRPGTGPRGGPTAAPKRPGHQPPQKPPWRPASTRVPLTPPSRPRRRCSGSRRSWRKFWWWSAGGRWRMRRRRGAPRSWPPAPGTSPSTTPGPVSTRPRAQGTGPVVPAPRHRLPGERGTHRPRGGGMGAAEETGAPAVEGG